MADVFISYRRDDRAKAAALAKALAVEALDVWWDDGLTAGEAFDQKIEAVLKEAKAVLVLWPPSSVKSEWVRGEAAIGRERGVLVPVSIRPTNIPVPFNLLNAVDLSGWSGDRSDPNYQRVVAKLKEMAGKKHVPPLKPPPNRQLRRLWQTVSVIGVLAVIGASLWVFRPWEAMIAAADPAARAKAALDKSRAGLAAYGVQPGDFAVYDWKAIARKRFRPETYEALKAAAATGDTSAEALLCAVANWGAGDIKMDDALASENCRKSSEGNDPVGQLYYGYILSQRQETDAAAQEFKKSADQGLAWGQLQYGYHLQEGSGFPKDPAHAVEVYKLAQAQGLPAADYALGMLYSMGLTAEPDRAAAAKLMRAAADKGYPPAIYQLGEFYRQGAGVPRDLMQAKAQYEKAAAQDDNEDAARKARGALAFIQQDIADEQAKSGATPQ
jgi:hypothetical protein